MKVCLYFIFTSMRALTPQIPVPLANSEIAAVSRRARDRWLQQDASAVSVIQSRSRSASPTNETVYAGGGTVRSGVRSGVSANRVRQRTMIPATPRDPLDHGCRCGNCNEWIMGRRYQCANCPSDPQAFNLVRLPIRVENPRHRADHSSALYARSARTGSMTPAMYSSNSNVRSIYH